MDLRCRSARMGSVVAVTTLITLTGAPAAFAEGPGYGGNADTLSVSWVPAAEAGTSDTGTTETGTTDSPEAPPVAPGDNDSPLQGMGASAIVLGGGARSAATIIRADGQPALDPDALALEVNGLGFRAKSEVVVRIGDGAPVTSRSDTAGSLSVAIDPDLLGGTEPGLTVVAIGRGPSGTAVALYGSVPPEPRGIGPMTVIPWLAASIAALSGGLWFRKRARTTRAADLAEPTTG
jgi:hypothetical protein